MPSPSHTGAGNLRRGRVGPADETKWDSRSEQAPSTASQLAPCGRGSALERQGRLSATCGATAAVMPRLLVYVVLDVNCSLRRQRFLVTIGFVLAAFGCLAFTTTIWSALHPVGPVPI